MVERSTVEVADIEWSLVRFRVSGFLNFGSLVIRFLNMRGACTGVNRFRDSIVVSISACHADDPGSIPGRGVLFYLLAFEKCEDLKFGF